MSNEKLESAGYGTIHLVAAALAGVIAGYAIAETRSPAPDPVTAAHAPAPGGMPAALPMGGGPSEPEHAAVQRVAGNFRCGCGRCEGENLAECGCEHPGGAIEVKGFILERLREGKSESAITEAVRARFRLPSNTPSLMNLPGATPPR